MTDLPGTAPYRVDATSALTPLAIAVLSVSDTRTLETDTSGKTLADRVKAAGHRLAAREVVTDEVDLIQSKVRAWIDDPAVDVVITTGGTGLTGRDVTPDAVRPLLTKVMDGFAVVFHMASYRSVGLSTLQSRALAGVAKSTYLFCLPGSNGAVKDGWDHAIAPQLDSRNTPCNLVEIRPRLEETRES